MKCSQPPGLVQMSTRSLLRLWVLNSLWFKVHWGLSKVSQKNKRVRIHESLHQWVRWSLHMFSPNPPIPLPPHPHPMKKETKSILLTGRVYLRMPSRGICLPAVSLLSPSFGDWGMDYCFLLRSHGHTDTVLSKINVRTQEINHSGQVRKSLSPASPGLAFVPMHLLEGDYSSNLVINDFALNNN